MKKFWKIVFINLIIVLIVIFSAEIILWKTLNQKLVKQGIIKEENIFPFHKGITPFSFDVNSFTKSWGRQPVGIKYKKKPIAVFGCSYAYGYNLEDNQTFAYKLSQKTKRPVHNRAYTGYGIQHMLYQAEKKELYEQISEPEYVIYVYIYDHLRRLYVDSFSTFNILLEEPYLRYVEKDGKLQELKNNFLTAQIKRLYLYNKLQHSYVKYVKLNDRKKYYNFAIKHFIQAKNEMQKQWKNTKYAVLLYDNWDDNRELKEGLGKEGIIVISLPDLTNTDLQSDKYLSVDRHPKEVAWDIIVSKLVKELKL